MRCVLITLLGAAALGAEPRPLTTGQMREDLAWFRQNVFTVEKSYSPSARAEAERRLSALETGISRTTPARFTLEIARIVALADNGHSAVFAGPRSRRFNRVPIRLTTFGDEFRVMRAVAAESDLLGARITAIDGHPVAVVRDSARTLQGGTVAWRDRNAPYFLESPEQLNALGLARDPRSAVYEFATASGGRVTRRLTGEVGWYGMTQPDFLMYPELDDDESGWVAVHPTAVPWSLAEPTTTFRWRAAPEVEGMVVQLRRIVDGPGQSIAEFLTAMTARIKADRPRNLVVDLRLNSGGNLNNTRDFMGSLPKLVPGRVFVITAPTTFSAAISSVGYLKQSAPDRVLIVGEEAGDRLVFFAEGRPVQAPNSGLFIGLATQRHDYQNGCKAFTDCHGPVVRFPISVATMKPDIYAPWTFADWKAGIDPAMRAIATAVPR